MKTLILAIATTIIAALSMFATKQDNVGAQPVVLFKTAGTTQCQERPDVKKASHELAAHGIEALRINCGSDGRMYPFQCGQPDGVIFIITILPEYQQAAEQLGYKPVASWNIVATSCQ